MNKERVEKIERAQRKEKSWELLRESTRYLKQNEQSLKIENEKNCKESKNARLKRAEQQRVETVTKIRQKKLTESWNRLPEEGKKKLKRIE